MEEMMLPCEENAAADAVVETEEKDTGEALAASEAARLEAEERARALEARLLCLEMGVPGENADDVIALAERLGGERSGAIGEVLEKYPFFRGRREEKEARPLNAGVHIGQSVTAPCSGVEEAFRRANPDVIF